MAAAVGGAYLSFESELCVLLSDLFYVKALIALSWDRGVNLKPESQRSATFTLYNHDKKPPNSNNVQICCYEDFSFVHLLNQNLVCKAPSIQLQDVACSTRYIDNSHCGNSSLARWHLLSYFLTILHLCSGFVPLSIRFNSSMKEPPTTPPPTPPTRLMVDLTNIRRSHWGAVCSV